jgi:hypothetical protein
MRLINLKTVLLITALAVTSCQPADNGGSSVSPVVSENKHFVVDDALIENDDVYAVIDPVWWTANIYDGVEAYERSLSSYSKQQRLVFAVTWYRSEVNNGGHDQFYYNSTGIVWPDALEAFQVIGLDSFAEVLNQSAERFSSPPSRDRDARNDQMDTDEPEFDDLDTRFYALEESVDMDAKLMEYIRRNRSDFYFDGSVSIPE